MSSPIAQHSQSQGRQVRFKRWFGRGSVSHGREGPKAGWMKGSLPCFETSAGKVSADKFACLDYGCPWRTFGVCLRSVYIVICTCMFYIELVLKKCAPMAHASAPAAGLPAAATAHPQGATTKSTGCCAFPSSITLATLDSWIRTANGNT